MGIGLSLDIDAHEPVVAMHRLAEVVGERDEVAGAEDMHRLAEADREAFVHIGRLVEEVFWGRSENSRPLRKRI